MSKLELETKAVTQLTRLLSQERKNLWNRRHLFWPSISKYMYVCVFVFSALWLRAPMNEWLDSLSVNMTTRVRIPLNVLLAWVDICAAELATWGVGPDVYTPSKGIMCPRNVM